MPNLNRIAILALCALLGACAGSSRLDSSDAERVYPVSPVFEHND
jgi:hypothetical protein